MKLRRTKATLFLLPTALLTATAILFYFVPSIVPHRDEGTGDTASSPNPPIHIQLFLSSSAPSPDAFVISSIMKDKFNIQIDWLLHPHTDYSAKLSAMIASDELKDIMVPFPIDQAKNAGMGGELLAFNPYLDRMPHVKSMLSADKIAYTSLLAEDGNLYGLPVSDPAVNFRYVPIIRKDLLDEAGLKEPETFEELYAVLQAVKARHPETLGIVNAEKLEALNDYGLNFNTNTGMFLDQTQDKFVYGPSNPGFKEMIAFFKKCWDAQLVDPEFFTSSEQDWENKIIGGQAVFWLSWPETAITYEEAVKKTSPSARFDSSPIPPLLSQSFGRRAVQGQPVMNTWTAITVSAKTPYADRIMPLIDWMYSEEGSVALQYGIPGETYRESPAGKTYTVGNLDELGIGTSGNLLLRVIRHDDPPVHDDAHDDVGSVLAQYVKNKQYILPNQGISLSFSQEQLYRKDQYEKALGSYVSQMAARLIAGEVPMSEYDAFTAELRNKGAGELEQIYAEAYDKFKQQIVKQSEIMSPEGSA